MEFRQLETFVAIAKFKSYSKAAESLFLTQPTLSNHIINLEKDLGTTLINRSNKQISLTPAGKILYDYAVEILHVKENVGFKLDEYRGHFVGHIEIAASTIPEQYILPSFLTGFKKQYPDVTLTLRHLASDKIIDGILTEEYNLGVVGSKTTHGHLTFHSLTEDELALVVPNNEAYQAYETEISWSELIKKPFIFREQGSGTRKLFEAALKKNSLGFRDLKVAAYIENTEVIKKCIMDGMGVSILSKRAIQQELLNDSLKALEIPDMVLTRHFYLVHHKYRTLSPLELRFKEYLMEHSE
ncbi:DNA-binding transcriptional regulator, LysR family [Tindallia magadiensis]|uniref:DNA-binding transcriptional regulator, LysR family n=1 Tax=Tindallia magadiensis TaxID=69895 RepID=A0A1I3HB75_9FIRM|nr:selenium metabolism-associated LysR family transcriptional regulator [Tindallia magadiensis]SFI32985.1 DNA-binding transcriptional regulator, LysR family [Tindallia magadiensis]